MQSISTRKLLVFRCTMKCLKIITIRNILLIETVYFAFSKYILLIKYVARLILNQFLNPNNLNASHDYFTTKLMCHQITKSRKTPIIKRGEYRAYYKKKIPLC